MIYEFRGLWLVHHLAVHHTLSCSSWHIIHMVLAAVDLRDLRVEPAGLYTCGDVCYKCLSRRSPVYGLHILRMWRLLNQLLWGALTSVRHTFNHCLSQLMWQDSYFPLLLCTLRNQRNWGGSFVEVQWVRPLHTISNWIGICMSMILIFWPLEDFTQS